MGKRSRHKNETKITSVERQETSEDYSKYVHLGILFVVFLTTTLIRTRLLSIPLGRDEGGFVYMSQLIFQRIPPFSISYALEFPAVYAACALILSIFGQSAVGIYLGFLLANLTMVLLVFLLTKHFFDLKGGAIAGASFAILSVSPTVFGVSAHASHFVILED